MGIRLGVHDGAVRRRARCVGMHDLMCVWPVPTLNVPFLNTFA